MPALVFLAFYDYLTSISSPVKIRILIERDRALMFRAPKTLTQMRWNETIENQRIKFFNEWLKVLEGKMSRPEFDKSVAIKT